MKRQLLTVLLVATALSVAAQTARKFTVNITPDGESVMTAYLPEQPSGRAVVALPGGGYSHLAMDHEGHDWAPYFNEQGIAYFVLKYRMPKGDRNIPLSDARQAIRTVRDSSLSWAVNPLDVGIMGSSAGGHLASSVSTHSEFDARPNFSILFYPVISMDQRVTHKGSCVNFLGEEGSKDEKLVKEWSNQNAVVSHLTPPAIIMTANDDGTVPPVTNGVAYYSAMRKAGNHCSLYVYPSGGHGFGFRTSYPYHDQLLCDLTHWLQSLPQHPRGAIRVACIGNSITHGSAIDMQEQKGYPAQLQQMLGRNYVVKNYGVGARCMMNTSDHPYMKEQSWRDAKAFLPNIVLIKLGTNDSKDYQWNQQQYEQDYQAMIDTLSALPSKPTIYLCTPIRAFQDRWGITDEVIVNGVIPSIKKLAERNHLQVIDLHPVVDDRRLMTSDMIHPNANGARKMAETIREVIKPRKQVYIPQDLRSMNLQSDTSLWSFRRSVQTDDLILMWQRGFGNDVSNPPALEGKPMKFDLQQLTSRVQDFYDYFRDTLQFVKPGSKSERYKMMVMVNYSLEGTAYGGTYDDFIGALWVAPNRIQDKTMNCMAHELGHCFQLQNMADSVSDCWGGSGFFEMTSQWMLWQVNPNWLRDENYHFEAFKKLTHKAYLHPTNIYHSPYVIQWWSDLHGKPSIGNLYHNGRRGEDPVMTYKRIYDMNQKQFCDEMFLGYQHLLNFDFQHARKETRTYACTFSSEVTGLDDGWQQPKDTLEAYGFNAIKLDQLIAKDTPLKKIGIRVKGKQVRYGFVAITKAGRSIYSPINARTMVLPADDPLAHLYLLVMGAPDKHEQLAWEGEPAQFVYQYKLTPVY
ncbi:MAG: alpha/beta hydrolase fold domain-containing protein [Prevotella sp.]|nr:alpha/beta hydrolase fold domain-containing protein [Prevotella sp.]